MLLTANGNIEAISEPLPYVVVEKDPSSGFKQELIYEGIVGNAVAHSIASILAISPGQRTIKMFLM